MKKISILFCSLICLVFATTARASMNDTINPVTGQPIPPLPDDMTELMTRGATSTSSGGLSVTLSAGWNWIGYMGASTKAINEALKTIQPSHGDMIKSQSQQASYSSATGLWSGPLTTLEPGKGYLYLHYGAPGHLGVPGDVPGGHIHSAYGCGRGRVLSECDGPGVFLERKPAVQGQYTHLAFRREPMGLCRKSES